MNESPRHILVIGGDPEIIRNSLPETVEGCKIALIFSNDIIDAIMRVLELEDLDLVLICDNGISADELDEVDSLAVQIISHPSTPWVNLTLAGSIAEKIMPIFEAARIRVEHGPLLEVIARRLTRGGRTAP